jgi:SAM-dependent methyltransferase
MEAHPEIGAQFDELMGPAGHGTPDAAVLPDERWQGVGTVVDVGGGTGALLAEVLRAHPHVRGTLVDLPRVAARAGALFDEAGVAERVTVKAQSFFEPLPAGADLYLLKSVLSDWPDDDAVRILHRCAEAARPSGGRVVVYTNAGLGEPAAPDLLMLVLVGGRERTIDELQRLGERGELRLVEARRIPSGKTVVEFGSML